MKKVWVIIKLFENRSEYQVMYYYTNIVTASRDNNWGRFLKSAIQYESEAEAEKVIRTFTKEDGDAFEAKPIFVWEK